MGTQLSLFCTDNQTEYPETLDSPPSTPDDRKGKDDEFVRYGSDLIAFYEHELNNTDH